MNDDEIARSMAKVAEALRPWFDRHARPAWRPVTKREKLALSWIKRLVGRDRGDAPLRSKFGGRGRLLPGEDWPRCGSCDLPLYLMLELNLEQVPSKLGSRFGKGLLQVFYCIESACAAELWAPFGGGKLVRVLPANSVSEVSELGPCDPFPEVVIQGWEEFIDFPPFQEHDELGLLSRYRIGEPDPIEDNDSLRLECPSLGLAWDDLPSEGGDHLPSAANGDKLAGWPHWIQGVEYPACPICGQLMQMFFQIDSNDHLDFMFGDCGCAHVTQCPTHLDVVALGWACC